MATLAVIPAVPAPQRPRRRGLGGLGRRVSEQPDAELVARAREGSREAAGELFTRHWPPAWRAALAVTGRRAMADDVAQDAFERAFAGLSRFDATRPFAPWLHRIVVNRALDLIRAERRLVGLERAGDVPEDWREDEPGDGPALVALAGLSAERRAVVTMRHLLGYSPPEIATLLELPLGTVHSRLGRALAELRDAVEESE